MNVQNFIKNVRLLGKRYIIKVKSLHYTSLYFQHHAVCNTGSIKCSSGLCLYAVWTFSFSV